MGCLCPVRHIDELETWEVGGKVLIWDKQVLIYFLKKSLFSGSKAVFLGKNESSPLACALPNQFLCIT